MDKPNIPLNNELRSSLSPLFSGVDYLDIEVDEEVRKYANLRFADRTCHDCRYFRIGTGPYSTTGACLLLGRTMGITAANNGDLILGWSRERTCNGWSRRPKGWALYVEDPHWKDPHLPREKMEGVRRRFIRRMKRRKEG